MIASTVFRQIICISLISQLCLGCPDSCHCEWRNGKQTVECVNRNLIIIPGGIDPATQVLDISGNNFQYLRREKFLTMSLVNLQKLFLSRCDIKIIWDDAFKGLTSLVELDLSENHLETVPSGSLLNCPSLMKLSLSKNPITSLHRLAFNQLSFLTNLDLRGCEITTVDEAAFSGLYSLEWIDLSQNQVRSFPDMRLFPNTLKGLQLEDNPWKCDCHLRTFSVWLKRYKVPISIQPVCFEPNELRGSQVIDLEVDDLLCIPDSEMRSNSFYFEVKEDRNLTLVCQVKSEPPARITWLFKGQTLQNNTELFPGIHLIYYIENGSEEQPGELSSDKLNSEDNRKFYCQAENYAGIAYANYTLMIILKRDIMKMKKDNSSFSTEIGSILLTIGLIVLSLCFVAMIMTLLRHQNKSKHLKPSTEKKVVKLDPDRRVDDLNITDSKQTNKPPGVSQTNMGSIQVTRNCFRQVPRANPDIINGTNSSEVLGHIILGTKVENNLHAIDMGLGPSVTALRKKARTLPGSTTSTGRNLHRMHTQLYLTPTLVSQLRPVSAPSFERFIENNNWHYTPDGYPIRPVANFNTYKSTVMTASSPGLISSKEASENVLGEPNEKVHIGED